MNRRRLLTLTSALAAAGLGAAATGASSEETSTTPPPLRPPADGKVRVGFTLAEGAVVIDFAGPWEVFDNVQGFELYTVAEDLGAVKAVGGLHVLPDYTFESAPLPHIVVVAAQSEPTPALLAWLRRAAAQAELVMSVCNGAFVLGQAGLLAGLRATTHHESYADFRARFDEVTLVRGVRWVDNGKIATSGGLSSGIDLALHVVERYHGRDLARSVANHLEYHSTGWIDPGANAVYAKRRVLDSEHPFCQVCEMDVARDGLHETYHGLTYYFCMAEHQAKFDTHPERYV